MGILNYTTQVPAHKSLAEINAVLIEHGAQHITMQTHEKKIVGLSFTMNIGGLPMLYVLPANVEGVTREMLKAEPYTSRRNGTRDQYEARVAAQAEWTAWRILKDWVEAQAALIESGQAEVGQAFLPFAAEAGGKLLYTGIVERNQLRLNGGV